MQGHYPFSGVLVCTIILLSMAVHPLAAQRCAGELHLTLLHKGDTLRFVPDSSTLDKWGFDAREVVSTDGSFRARLGVERAHDDREEVPRFSARVGPFRSLEFYTGCGGSFLLIILRSGAEGRSDSMVIDLIDTEDLTARFIASYDPGRFELRASDTATFVDGSTYCTTPSGQIVSPLGYHVVGGSIDVTNGLIRLTEPERGSGVRVGVTILDHLGREILPTDAEVLVRRVHPDRNLVRSTRSLIPESTPEPDSLSPMAFYSWYPLLPDSAEVAFVTELPFPLPPREELQVRVRAPGYAGWPISILPSLQKRGETEGWIRGIVLYPGSSRELAPGYQWMVPYTLFTRTVVVMTGEGDLDRLEKELSSIPNVTLQRMFGRFLLYLDRDLQEFGDPLLRRLQGRELTRDANVAYILSSTGERSGIYPDRPLPRTLRVHIKDAAPLKSLATRYGATVRRHRDGRSWIVEMPPGTGNGVIVVAHEIALLDGVESIETGMEEFSADLDGD